MADDDPQITSSAPRGGEQTAKISKMNLAVAPLYHREELFGSQPYACAPATEGGAWDPEAIFSRENVNENIYILGGDPPQPIRPKFQK